MSVGAVSTNLNPEPTKVIYLVERRANPAESTPPTLLAKVKYAAGAAIALFGLILLSCAALALFGNAVGWLAWTAGNLEMAFMIGLVATVAGFNLSTKTSQPAEIYLGPLSVTV